METNEAVNPVKAVAKKSAKKPKGPSQEKRERVAKLNSTLAKKRCRFCGATGCWTVETTRRNIQYIRCHGCQRTDYIKAVEI